MRFIPALALIAALCNSAQATVVTATSTASVARKADVIAVGRVINVQTVVENGNPWTVATIVSEQTVKGKPPSTIQVRIPGGQRTVNGRTVVTAVDGAPTLNINQKGVFFVNKGESSDAYDFTGLNHGYWRVENQSGQEVAIPSVNESAPAIPLDRFLNDIRQAIKEAKEFQ